MLLNAPTWEHARPMPGVKVDKSHRKAKKAPLSPDQKWFHSSSIRFGFLRVCSSSKLLDEQTLRGWLWNVFRVVNVLKLFKFHFYWHQISERWPPFKWISSHARVSTAWSISFYPSNVYTSQIHTIKDGGKIPDGLSVSSVKTAKENRRAG